jgi:hypothetical protein
MKRLSQYSIVLITAAGLGAAFATETLLVQANEHDSFNPNDVRVFKATACTKDHSPVEALYYIAASRSDMAQGKPSPTSKLMKEEIDRSWDQIASRLSKDEVMEESFADKYNSVLREMTLLLQQAVKEKSGVSIYVSEVNSRLMDAAKDKDIPTCRTH